VMLFDDGFNRWVFISLLAVFFSVLALNLVVPVTVLTVMAVVDRILVRLWFGPSLFNFGVADEEPVA
jgi:hypothetical protein